MLILNFKHLEVHKRSFKLSVLYLFFIFFLSVGNVIPPLCVAGLVISDCAVYNTLHCEI